MEPLLAILRAAAEPTRLRLLVVCATGEFTVSELTQILGQSQPRISRHLKLMCEAGILSRSREGTWAFYRLSENQPTAELARTFLSALALDDPFLSGDRGRLAAVRDARHAIAAAYFRDNAVRWDQIRALHVPEARVEEAIVRLLPLSGNERLLDIGTGTGRMLELLGPQVDSALGIDESREMLAVARMRLEQAGLSQCQVRLADMYQLNLAPESFDLVLIHQVLHFSESPAEVLTQAARVLRPGGRLLVVDFAPHDLEALRSEHAHRRLGFAEAEITGWCRQAGLICAPTEHLSGSPLTVSLWLSVRPCA